ncbi:MAG: hypothetical protein EOP07_27005 [Proteobacteria bacterium]|nr:MAG: hypothetical protein EOP07_27005 [Pseudomonadota bacterium]
MKTLSTALCAITLACSSLAFSGTAKNQSPVQSPVQSEVKEAQLFDILNNKLVPSERVEDSVFYYRADDINCLSDDEETPCLAKEDKWTSICFQGDIEDVCPQMKSLFEKSDEQLMYDGAEESVQLTSCSSETGITVLSYDLISFHGGPNVAVKDKMIAMCPIFVK